MGFLFFPIWVWGSAWRPFGPPELHYNVRECCSYFSVIKMIDFNIMILIWSKRYVYFVCSECCKFDFSGIHKNTIKCLSVMKLKYVTCTVVECLLLILSLSSLPLNLNNASDVTSLSEIVDYKYCISFGTYSIYINSGKL